MDLNYPFHQEIIHDSQLSRQSPLRDISQKKYQWRDCTKSNKSSSKKSPIPSLPLHQRNWTTTTWKNKNPYSD
ncbi:hypothetical protein CEXT_474681 [Caerostris extrusa]|uniref:Uncharacterized protein n=1 Tax=Caerostris extrusa TaxID=172846 RepID=A0AAV4T8I1_CAEEX|nr:hypothetical protein CEXT_474681 [Caerostris extrusa]